MKREPRIIEFTTDKRLLLTDESSISDIGFPIQPDLDRLECPEIVAFEDSIGCMHVTIADSYGSYSCHETEHSHSFAWVREI